MKRGSRPKPYPVPKLEDLLLTLRPQILVMQTGNNLLASSGWQNRAAARHGSMLKSLIAPFISEALKESSTLQRIYGSPLQPPGECPKRSRIFLSNRSVRFPARIAIVIDSRPLVRYPYRAHGTRP